MTTKLVDPFRPLGWSEYVGQARLKERLMVSIEAALISGRPLDHFLLCATPGAGKSSLASLVADEMGSNFHEVNAPLDRNDLLYFVGEHAGILFIDEIHRLTTAQQEDLLPFLEHRRIELGRGNTMSNPQLSIIGASTEPQKIIKPLRQRFIVPAYDPYSEDEMATIVRGMGEKVGLDLDDHSCHVLGRAAAGVPRQAGTLVRAARDLQQARGEVDPLLVLQMEQVDPNGLTREHRDYLEALLSLHRRAGLRSIALRLRLHEDVVLDLEQMLLDRGLILYTDRGRVLTEEGRAVLR